MTLAVCLLVAAVVGCKTRRQQTTPAPHAAREHRTFAIETDAVVDTTLAVRDLFTGEALTLERRGALLVLRSSAGVIDTLTAPGRDEADSSASQPADSGPHAIARIDSSFVQLTSTRGEGASSLTADVVGVADGRLHWAARLPGLGRLPGAESRGVHSTSFSILRSPLALAGSEMFSPTMSESGAPTPWSAPFDLRFDDSARAFYNVSIALDAVPMSDGSPAVSGRYPGIALRLGTSVMIDRQWYALSLPEDLDPEEFARGTVGLVLEGKGEWGDTLRPVALAGAASR